MIGKIVSHYKILEKLGSGGMGVVYKAEDTKLKRLVALKFLPAQLTEDREAKARFIHEARAASALQHSTICTIHEIDEAADGQMYICMDYYEGETLRSKINRGPLKIEEAIDIAIQIARGLAAAHEAGEIHRDIKPANIIVTKKGEVKIVDFGLAKLARQTKLTVEGSTLGTVAYMSPEQARGDTVDHRSDIWSLGVVLYEMICGKSPFKSDYDQATLYAIINEQAEPPTALRTGVPLELERIICKALIKNPDERYQHVDDLQVDLKRVQKPENLTEKPASSDYKIQKTKKNILNRYTLLTSAGVLLLLAYIFLKPIIEEKIAGAEPRPIVVISFKNQTGDSKYDYLQEAIPSLLITNLEQSRYLRVLSWERIHDLLEQIGQSEVELIDEEIGFQICRREGIEAIVLGSFIKAGDVFATDVKVLDVNSKQLLKSASARGEGVGSILQDQIDALSREISRGVNITESRIENTALRISEATTPSMEAYHYFIRGRDAYEKFYYEDACRYLNNAIELDSAFALAYLYLARSYSALREEEIRDACFEKAKIYAKNIGEKDRLYIEAAYAGYIEKNPEKRYQILQNLVSKFPHEKRAYDLLGYYYGSRKQYEQAIAMWNKALALDPNYAEAYNGLAYLYGDMKQFQEADQCLQKYADLLPGDANPYDSMAEFYIRTGRINLAIEKYKEALEIKPNFGSEWRIAYLYALEEDFQSTISWLERHRLSSQIRTREIRILFWKGIYNYYAGRRRAALADLNTCIAISQKANSLWGVATSEFFKAWILFDQAKFEQSKTWFTHYYQNRINAAPQYLTNYKADHAFQLGLIFAGQGKFDSARSELDKIRRLFPHLTPSGQERHTWAANFLYSQILVAEDSLDKALEIRNRKRTLDRPFAFVINYLFYNFPISHDRLAQAYARNNQTEEAIAEYRLLLEKDPEKRGYRIINPIYHYKLAKLLQQKGSDEEARKEYTRFLEVWKNADKELPEYNEAQKQLQYLTESTHN